MWVCGGGGGVGGAAGVAARAKVPIASRVGSKLGQTRQLILVFGSNPSLRLDASQRLVRRQLQLFEFVPVQIADLGP